MAFASHRQGRIPGLPTPLTIAGILLFSVVALLPPGIMLVKSLIQEGQLSFGHYQAVFGDLRTWILLARSGGIACGATLVACVLGIPFALAVSRISFPGNTLCRMLYLVPLFIPPHVHGLAWIALWGEKGFFATHLPCCMLPFELYTVPCVALVLGLCYLPLVILPVITGLQTMQHSMEEAAVLSRHPLAALLKITLPLLKPYCISGGVFVFIFSFFNYGVSSMFRISTFPVEIMARFSAFYDEAGAAALCAPTILLAVLLLGWQQWMLAGKEFVAISHARQHSEYHSRLIVKTAAAIFCLLILCLTVLLPVAALVQQAGSWSNYLMALKTSYKEIGASLLTASLAATATTILAYLVARHVESSRNTSVQGFVTYLPFAFPATLFGIGLIYTWNTSATQMIYTTTAILLLACMGRFIPFAVRILSAGLKQVHPHQLEAALLCESSLWRRLTRIELPLLLKPLCTCWCIVFIFSMGELGATLLVIPPGLSTASLKIYTLMHYGAGSLVAALSLILMFTTLCISTMLFLTTARGAA
ncbi:ABC transporter permease [Desulfogranum japonicum]|uniref:ABC transporter permease n=1 Tax=Desulfogranum japonicum TaxID=231447 RepID=UPI000428856D|nr:iron ABC transporter permease [Desulfogranum japonicum]